MRSTSSTLRQRQLNVTISCRLLAVCCFGGLQLKELSAYHAQEMTSKHWFDDAKEYAELLLPAEATAAVLDIDQDNDFTPHKASVEAVYASSSTGKKLMAKVMRQLAVECVSRLVKTTLDTLKGQSLTKKAFDTCTAEFVKQMKAAGTDPLVPYSKKKRWWTSATGGSR